MSGFDAITHSMTTISTGGFSNHNSSFSFFNSQNIEIISVVFMIVGSLPFVVFLKFIHGEKKSIYSDDQIKLFFSILFFLVIITSFWLYYNYYFNFSYSFRLAIFNITSILTGTGYVSTNYNLWGGFGFVIIQLI